MAAAVDVEARAVLQEDAVRQLVGQGRKLAPGAPQQRLQHGAGPAARAARVAGAECVLRFDAEEPFHRYCPPSWRLAARKAALSCDSARSIASAPCSSRRSAAARRSGCAADTAGPGPASGVS